jgi:hypothetical protein
MDELTAKLEEEHAAQIANLKAQLQKTEGKKFYNSKIFCMKIFCEFFFVSFHKF